MDTSILDTLYKIAPDLMEQMEVRALVLERVGALGPIGRRALASRLHLTEREVRAAADALRAAGCVSHSAAGMELTEHGQNLVEASRAVSRGRRTLGSLEQTLERKLGVRRVCVVRGDADFDPGVMREAAREAARQLRLLLAGARVIAVTGGRTVAMTAQEVEPAAPVEITVVPAQGGQGGVVRTQANTVAELLAERLGGAYRLLHVPDGLPLGAADELTRLPQVREVLELLRHADVLLYGVARAEDLPERRGMRDEECRALLEAGVVAEALGFYFDAQGCVVSGGQSLALRPEELGERNRAAVVAVGGKKAEAILAVCAHHPHELLVTDEGAAARMARLLRL